MKMNKLKPQQGLTLIELMIAITLSAIITAAIATLFIQSRRSNEQNDLIARMQENGRFAMQFLREELIHADFFGNMTNPGDITPGTLTALSPTNCNSTNPNWYRTFTNSSDRIIYDYNETTPNTNAYDCISNDTFVSPGNILTIKRAKGDPVDNSSATADNKIYLRSNGSSGMLYHFSSSSNLPTSLGTIVQDWEYDLNIFFIRNKSTTDLTPVLYRYYLQSGGTPTMTAEPLVENIEYFHILFGIDSGTPGDGVADYYTFSPSNAELAQAVSVRLYVLVRAEKTTSGYTNNKTYDFGGGVTRTVNDSYYRRLYTTTMTLKNPRNQILLGQ